MQDIASAMKVNTNYVSQYRPRLIRQELIRPRGHGLVDFALPPIRDYLRQHATQGGQ